MSGASLFITIVRPDCAEGYAGFFSRRGFGRLLGIPCRGTAQRRWLDYLGIEDNEKTMFQTVVPAKRAAETLRALVGEMGIDVPGAGIALTVPLESAGGKSALEYFSCGLEGIEMEQTKHSLIVAITAPGGSEAVMDAARASGAGGGTVIHAKGTANGEGAKFFGISLAPEKEMIYIVVRKCDKDAVMRSIMESESDTVVFSLPVDGVAGLRSVAE